MSSNSNNNNNNNEKTKQLPKLEYVINQPDNVGYLSPPPIQTLQKNEVPQMRMRSFSDELEEKSEKRMEYLKKLAKYNPLVPIGCLVTIGVLGNGVWAMKNNNRNKSQRMMRYRVAAQGITVIALVVGTMATQFIANLDEPRD